MRRSNRLRPAGSLKKVNGALLPFTSLPELRIEVATRVKIMPAPMKMKRAIRFEADLPCFAFCCGEGSKRSGLSGLIYYAAFQ